MSARDAILARLGAKLDAKAPRAERERAADVRLKAKEQHGPIPKIGRTEGRDRVERFVAAAEAVQARVTRLSTVEQLPGALAEHLRGRNLPTSVRAGDDPSFDGLNWGALELSRGPGRVEEPVSLSRAAAGVAETGTLVLLSGPENPVTLTFLGETHCVVLRARDIEAGLEGVWAKLRAARVDPRTVNLVTGPSRTGDIAQQIELGAHGPIDVQIFLIDDV